MEELFTWMVSIIKSPVNNITIIAHDNSGSRELFDGITSAYPDLKFQLVLTEGLYYRKNFFHSVYKMIKEASFIFCFVRFIELLIYKFDKNIKSIVRDKSNCIYFKTKDVNNAFSVAKISAFNPDIIISTFTMHIVGRDVIKIPKIAAIGAHPSILPSYRGLEVFFWQLANGEEEAGVSVFYLDEKIDAGPVFLLERYSIVNESLDSLYRKMARTTTKMLIEAIEMLLTGKQMPVIKTEKQHSYFPMPTKSACSRFIKRGCRWK
jgi:folate-dependent phosphoribosylglycinamide formyltransferase PurN